MGGGAASMVTGPSLSGFSLFETICQRRSGIHMYIYVCVCKYIYIYCHQDMLTGPILTPLFSVLRLD